MSLWERLSIHFAYSGITHDTGARGKKGPGLPHGIRSYNPRKDYYGLIVPTCPNRSTWVKPLTTRERTKAVLWFLWELKDPRALWGLFRLMTTIKL